MAAVAKLKALLGMDNKQFKAGMRDSKQATQSFSSSIAKIGGTLAAAFSIRAIVGFTKSVVDFASEIRHTADNLNVSTDALQALNSVSLKYGMTVEDLHKGLGKLRQSQGKVAEGDKEYTDAVELLNINLKEFEKADTARALELLAKGYAAAGGSALAFSAVQDLMGRSAKKATAFMEELARMGLKPMIAGAKTAGMVIKEDLITELELMGTKMELIGLKSKTIWAKLVIGVVNVSKAYVDFVDKIIWGNQKLGDTKTLVDSFLYGPTLRVERKMREEDTKAAPAELSPKEKARLNKIANLRAEYFEKSYMRELKNASPEGRLALLKAEALEVDKQQMKQGNSPQRSHNLEMLRWKVVDEIAATEKEIADTKAKSEAKSANEAKRRLDKIAGVNANADDALAALEAPGGVRGQGLQTDSLARAGGFVGPQRPELAIADRQLKINIERNRILQTQAEDIRIIKENTAPSGEVG